MSTNPDKYPLRFVAIAKPARSHALDMSPSARSGGKLLANRDTHLEAMRLILLILRPYSWMTVEKCELGQVKPGDTVNQAFRCESLSNSRYRSVVVPATVAQE